MESLGRLPGAVQELLVGSHGVVPNHPMLQLNESFTLAAWISPTTPSKSAQGIITKWSDSAGTGYGMFVDGDNGLTLWLGGTDGRVERISTGVALRAPALRAPAWYLVAVSYDASSRQVLLYQQPKTLWPMDETIAVVEAEIAALDIANNEMPLIIAGYGEGDESDEPRINGHYNGKIDGPAVFGRSLSQEELASILDGASPTDFGDDLIGAWDFTRDFATAQLTDRSKHGLDGVAGNRPARAMKGHNWTASYTHFNLAPQEYGAIHFHDDDLDDARWDVSFEFNVPEDMKSGVYAARLTDGDAEDYVPFCVRPATGAAVSRILFLMPTNSYLTYANNHSYPRSEFSGRIAWEPTIPQDKYIEEHHLNSTYDVHTDGSPVLYTSRLRPNLTMRPKYNFWYLHLGRGGPWQFNADLHLVDWLDAQGYEYDVATDEDVQREGAELFNLTTWSSRGATPNTGRGKA